MATQVGNTANFTVMMRMTGNLSLPRSLPLGRALPWVILLFLIPTAVLLANERLYSDSGYYLVQVIHGAQPHVEHGRVTLALSQLLAWFGVCTGLPLNTIILLHSLNNVVWLAACMLVTHAFLRDQQATLLLATTHLIGLTHGLFCPIFELYYAVDLIIVAFALHRTTRWQSPWRPAVIIAALVLAISGHFMSLPLIMGFAFAHREALLRRDRWILSAVIVLVIAVRVTTMSTYETGWFSVLNTFMERNTWRDLSGSGRILEWVAYLFDHYPDVSTLLLFTSILFVFQRAWADLVLLLGIMLMLHLAISVLLPGTLHDRYREQVNFSSVAWVLMMLITRTPTSGSWRTALLLALSCAVLFRMGRLVTVAPAYEARTSMFAAWIKQARNMGLSKGIVMIDHSTGPLNFATGCDHVDLSWSTSIETLLLSAADGPASTVSILTSDDLGFPEVAEQLDLFILRRWDILDPEWLPAQYFEAPQGRYTVLDPDRPFRP